MTAATASRKARSRSSTVASLVLICLRTCQSVYQLFASKLAYPTGGNDGDLLAKDGTDAEWIAVPEAGLTLITAETFSAVSSVSVNGCFSGTYRHYRLVISGAGSLGSSPGLSLRWRASGTDATSADYNHAGQANANTGASHVYLTGQTSALIGHAGNNVYSQSLDVFAPFESARTSNNALSTAWGTTAAVSMYVNGEHQLTTSYDGFTIFPSTGTITGTVRVYGYKD